MAYATLEKDSYWPPDRFHDFSQRALKAQYKAGTVLFWPGDRAECVYLVETGYVKVCHYTDRGGVVTLFIHGPGELVGAGGVLDNRGRAVYAMAEGDCTVWEIPKETFFDLLETEPGFAIFVARDFARRLRNMDQHVLRVSSLPVGGRLVLALLDLAGQAERNGDGTITIRITHQELSDMIGACRQTTTVALRDLKQKGLLLTQKGSILLTDLDALRREAGGPTEG